MIKAHVLGFKASILLSGLAFREPHQKKVRPNFSFSSNNNLCLRAPAYFGSGVECEGSSTTNEATSSIGVYPSTDWRAIPSMKLYLVDPELFVSSVRLDGNIAGGRQF